MDPEFVTDGKASRTGLKNSDEIAHRPQNRSANKYKWKPLNKRERKVGKERKAKQPKSPRPKKCSSQQKTKAVHRYFTRFQLPDTGKRRANDERYYAGTNKAN